MGMGQGPRLWVVAEAEAGAGSVARFGARDWGSRRQRRRISLRQRLRMNWRQRQRLRLGLELEWRWRLAGAWA